MHVLISALHRPVKPTGVCRHAVNLAQCLAYTAHVSQVTLLIGKWQEGYFNRDFNLKSSKIKLLSVDIPNTSLSRNYWFIFGLPKIAHQVNPDIIHMSFPVPFLQRWFEVPVVATIHDLYPYECPENFGYPQAWFNQLFLQQCINQSDGLACVSKCTLGTLVEHFPFIKNNKLTAVIYNIVDFYSVNPKIPEELGNTFSRPFLLTVAQHRKNKNLDLLIQAYHALLQENRLEPYTELFLVGSQGPETTALENLIKSLGLSKQVRFLSGLEDTELCWLYENASTFIIPSSSEGFCLPLIEALNLGCPVVCSDIPIFREVGSSQCRYFELSANACRNMAEAIEYQFHQKTVSNSLTENQFSKKTISKQLLNFYESLA